MEDAHFLARLERVNVPQEGLALSLYRDPKLVEFLLQRLRLPEGVERVGLSLDHDTEGPFVVLTRKGKFVTCLGAGMSPGDLKIITRGHLDALCARFEDLRFRIETARRVGGEGGMSTLVKKILDQGDSLSREEFIAISAWQPILQQEFSDMLVQMTENLETMRPAFIHMGGLRVAQLKPRQIQGLRAYWRLMWAAGHLAVLTAMNGDSHPILGGFALERDNMGFFSWGTVSQGIFSQALKGLWGVARVGKLLLPVYKRALQRAPSFHLIALNALGGLAVLAFRHSKLKAEIKKALTRVRPDGPPYDAHSHLAQKFTALFSEEVVRLLDDPHPSRDWARELGRQAALYLAKFLPQGSPYRYQSEEEVPDDIACSLLANWPEDLLHNTDAWVYFFEALPWLAQVDPEYLYLPEELLRATYTPWKPEKSLEIAERWRRYFPPKEPTRAKEKLGRNDPCSCGSGKKYKKCCGA